MKATPLLFRGQMIRGLLGDIKTQTRRLVKLPRWAQECNEDHEFEIDGDPPRPYAISKKSGCLAEIECPYGEPGDLMWARETWARYKIDQESHSTAYRATQPIDWPEGGNWRPSIFMPRRESRITLRITDVRVQRLHEITPEDAAAEGWPGPDKDNSILSAYPTAWYAKLWDEINGVGSFDLNPLVWALSFSVIQRNVDEVLSEAA